MPELPEVETIKNSLKLSLVNKKIIDVEIIYPKIIEYPSVDQFIKQIKNQTITDIKRRGKWLLFELNDYYLLSHLRMEGKYHERNNGDVINKHEHVIFKFNDNTELRYQDTRKFGRMLLMKKDEIYIKKPLKELGFEPWDNDLTVNYLKQKYKNKSLPIKTVLLDQTIIVGIGNIYADEILFLSSINPYTKAKDLKNKDIENIIKHTKEVLEKAILLKGTTIKSYEPTEGHKGSMQSKLLVHQREGETCVCGTVITKVKIGGRGTYYCQKCQK